MSNLSLGQKIRNYRKRRNISQIKLELETASAFGSISRIENDIVKPTRETLSKIARALHLSSHEIADLLDINIVDPAHLLTLISELSKSLDLNTTMQTGVNIIVDVLPNYIGGVIFLVEGEKILSRTIAAKYNIDKASALLPKKFNQLSIDLHKQRK